METGILVIVMDYDVEKQDAILATLREYGLKVMVRQSTSMDLERTQKINGRWNYKYKLSYTIKAQGNVSRKPGDTSERVARRIARDVYKANGSIWFQSRKQD